MERFPHRAPLELFDTVAGIGTIGQSAGAYYFVYNLPMLALAADAIFGCEVALYALLMLML